MNNGAMTNEQWCVFDLTSMVLYGIHKLLSFKKICGLLDAGITSLTFLQDSFCDKTCQNLFTLLYTVGKCPLNYSIFLQEAFEMPSRCSFLKTSDFLVIGMER